MSDELSFRFFTSLYTDCRMQDDDRILVGVSGGIDSMFLLSQLYELEQPVMAAVFNHGLRLEAEEECDFVESFCSEREIPCVRGKADVRSYAAAKNMGIEAAARELRYQFLFKTASENECKAVATAHHENDQAETILMHILRGAGIDGLCGMRPYSFLKEYSESIPLIRPLLNISREEIEKYAAEIDMPYREDRSNDDPSYLRNRIRKELLPQLKADYNPQIVSSLCRLAKSAAADKELLDGACEDAIRYASFYLLDEGCEWSRKTYKSYAIGMRYRMLRELFSRMGADLSEIGYHHLIVADHLLMKGRYNQTIPLLDGLWLRCEGDRAMILTTPDVPQWRYPQLSQGWSLYCETRHIQSKDLPEWKEKAKNHPEWAVLDANQVADYPILRTIRPGERFEPYGMGGKSQKLSDFLVNNKIPVQYRDDLVVAADSGGIIWVPGLRVSNRCALYEWTHRIMILKLKKDPPE